MFLIKKAVFKPIDCKDSANERNIKIKTQFLILDSRVPPIFYKDSANERNIKIKTQFLILEECDERMTGGGVE